MLHTIRPLIETQSVENNIRIAMDIVSQLRTVEHYNLIHSQGDDIDPDLGE